MDNKEQISASIFKVIDDINRELPPDLQLNKSLDTVLFGQGGGLDSLGLVNFVVASEQKILEDFSKPVSISDERAMSQKNSPFRTIGTLVDYIEMLLKE